METGTRDAFAEVSLLQAKLVDDAKNPYYPMVVRLLDIREVLSQSKIPSGVLMRSIDEALDTLIESLRKEPAADEVPDPE